MKAPSSPSPAESICLRLGFFIAIGLSEYEPP